MEPATNFFLAIKNNRLDMVENLLSSNSVDVDHKFYPESPIFLAIESEHIDMVSLLISHGCSVNAKDRRGETPLHKAVRDRRPDLAEILVKERANVQLRNDEQLNALQLSVFLRCFDILKIMVSSLASGSDRDRLLFHGRSGYMEMPFEVACHRGYDEIVVYLLGFITDDIISEYFYKGGALIFNPFNYALRLEAETVEALTRRFPPGKFQVGSARWDWMNRSPLHELAEAGPLLQRKSGRMATILVSLGLAPTESRDSNGRTPLHAAVRRGNREMVEALLRAGCRIDVRDMFGESPLYYAAHLPSPYLVNRLLAFDADLSRERWLQSIDRSQQSHDGNQLLDGLITLNETGSLISLQRLCRIAVRKYLKVRADEVIGKLICIPQKLKSFLMVENAPELLKF